MLQLFCHWLIQVTYDVTSSNLITVSIWRFNWVAGRSLLVSCNSILFGSTPPPVVLGGVFFLYWTFYLLFVPLLWHLVCTTKNTWNLFTVIFVGGMYVLNLIWKSLGRQHNKFQRWPISWFRCPSELLESGFREVWEHVLWKEKVTFYRLTY